MIRKVRGAPSALALLVAMGLVATGCSAGSSPSAGMASDAMESMDMSSMDEHAEFDFGEPADAADADRTIEIAASDQFAYDPAEVEVAVGETITFRVENTGNLAHEFVLGDEHDQEHHEDEMANMSPGMAMHDDPNAISLEAGETKEITWTFTTAGEILYGCHVSGHYASGMVGTIHVTE